MLVIKSINHNAREYFGEDAVNYVKDAAKDGDNVSWLDAFGPGTTYATNLLTGGGKGDVETPKPSAEELALMATQNELLQAQLDYTNQMMPVYAHQMHYSVDPKTGAWTQMSDDEWYNSPMITDRQRQEWDMQGKQMKRYEQALAGEIPLTQQMIDQKQTEFENLRDASGLSGDTPENASAEDTIGVQKLGEFNKRWGLVEEAQRYGELGTAGQAALQGSSLTGNLATQKVGTLSGIGQGYGGLANQFGNLLQPYQMYNQMGYQASAQNQSNQMQQQGSLLNLVGMLGAAYLKSSRTYKKDIKAKTPKDEDKALKSIRDTKSYEYRYKNYMGFGKDKMLGAIAEESPDEVTTPDKKAINLGNKIELIGMGLKSLARKMDKLERKVS